MSGNNGAAPSQSQINSLIEDYQYGRYGRAEKLAVSLTRQFPDYQFSWKLLGAVLKQTGRTSESLVASRNAVKLAPHDAEARYNMGIALQELGRLEEAEASCKQATALKPDFAEAHCNLGNTRKELGRLEEAEASYKQAIALKPDYAEAHNNLGVIQQDLGRLDEAEASYRQAIALKPDYAEAHYNLGILFYSAKEYKKALEPFKASDFGKSKNYLLRCLYEQDQQSLFFDQLDYLINLGEIHPMIGSLGCRSLLRYGVERPNLFCKDPLKYVLKTDLRKQYNFEKVFVETIRPLLNEKKLSKRRQGLLTNGYQTSGNLFRLERNRTEEIQKIIRLEIEKYLAAFKDSEEGFITNWPTDYILNGWLISMKSGGELRPHMHEKGWLSGTVYINVPPKSDPDSGNLVVSIGEEEDATDTRKNLKKSIDVVTGSLVLFPASLMHYTIPFQSEEERICIAFDVMPK